MKTVGRFALALALPGAGAWLTLQAPAAEPAALGAASPPPFKEVGPGLFTLDLVRLDQNTRTISFPAIVNLTTGNLEYLVVTTTGKTHESLLRTEARPLQLQLAFLLLGAKGSTNAVPEDPAQAIPGDLLTVELQWQSVPDFKTTKAAPAENFVTDVKAGAAMSAGPWVYTGSRLRPEGFAADLDGSIISLITDSDALINNPRRGREDDDNWLARPENLPPVDSQVTVYLHLLPGKEEKQNPRKAQPIKPAAPAGRPERRPDKL